MIVGDARGWRGSVDGAVLRIDRERFLSLAFCWAELVIEVDGDNRIVAAEGATELLLGRNPAQLTGRGAERFIAAEDVTLFRSLLATARRNGRTEDVALRLAGAIGPSTRLAFAAYYFRNGSGNDGDSSVAAAREPGDAAPGLSFLAIRRYRPFPLGESRVALARDEETGVFDAETFLHVAAQRIARHRSDQHLRITLIALVGCEALHAHPDRAAKQRLLQAIGACLRSNSLAGDAAGRIHANRYAFIHNARQTIALVEKRIERLLRSAAPLGAGCTVEAASIDIDSAEMAPELVVAGLRYAVNRFKHRAVVDVPLRRATVVGAKRAGTPDASTTVPAEHAMAQERLLPTLIATPEATRLSEQARASNEAVERLQRVIDASDFQVAFQPIVDVGTGDIHHYEALARFPTGTGMQNAYEHITFAEESGLIGAFDLAMARKVIGWLRTLAQPNDVTIAINISGVSVGSLTYLGCLDAILAANPWLRGRLMFEITESARMERLGPANTFIRRLRDQGFPVCLDDFGAGAANFRYLARLEVDIVKLDGPSLHNARKERTGKAFLKALVGLCDDLGIATVAEMVEDEAGLAFVRDCGVRYVQGHLFGRPSSDIASFPAAIPRHLF
ncbi:MAG: EAL domain-containing protein [Rhodospirillales bacterium]|nr:EAL domain-containing protein [Rhodospirillales bacterium]